MKTPVHLSLGEEAIVLKKKIKIMLCGVVLSNVIRYFFCITNDEIRSASQILEFYRDRADHENDIAQLKSGTRALHAPSNNLTSNWAYGHHVPGLDPESLVWTAHAL